MAALFGTRQMCAIILNLGELKSVSQFPESKKKNYIPSSSVMRCVNKINLVDLCGVVVKHDDVRTRAADLKSL